MDYRLRGREIILLVFDGDIGGNLEEWNPIEKN